MMQRPETLRSTSGLPSWHELLVSASTTGQIVALANEYLGRLEPSDLLLLPDTCKIRFLHGADDVNAYAFDLKTCRCKDAEEAEVVDRLSSFFQEICQRLANVTGPQKVMHADPWLHWGEVTRTVE